MSQESDDFVARIVALNQLLASEESLEDSFRRIASLARHTVGPSDSAGFTMERKGRLRTVAHDGDLAMPLDDAQYDSDDGPCVRAFRRALVVHLDPVSDHADVWPAFAAEAARLNVTCSLSLPLLAGDRTVGALNLYAIEPGAFDDTNLHFALLFAAQAAVVTLNSDRYWQTVELTEHLQLALDNRDIIGQAKGILMTSERLTSDEAFERLRDRSQALNRKLRDVADEVARTGELPPTS